MIKRVLVHLLVFLLCVFWGCRQRSSLQTAIEKFPTLKGLLDHYKDDAERLRAAKFVISNIEDQYSMAGDNNARAYNVMLDSVEQRGGINNKADLRRTADRPSGRKDYSKTYDTEIISVDSLIASIDYSFEAWSMVPWAGQYSFEQFCNYVLPYRILHEPLEYYWKEDCRKRFGHLLQESATAPLEVAEALTAVLPFEFNPSFIGDGIQSYSSIIQKQQGKCDDGALLRTMALRSLGVPAAIDFVPYWGSHNNGHSMAVVITPDDRCIDIEVMHQTQWTNYRMEHKTPKIYRQTFPKIDNTLNKQRNDEIIPSVFNDLHCMDVTDQYVLDTRDVHIAGKREGEIMYLAVFSRQGWQPVAYTCNGRKGASFRHVGIGSVNGINQLAGESIGDGIVYLPGFYTEEGVVPVSHPFILSADGQRELRPDTTGTETIILCRKYPMKAKIAGFAAQMVGGVFEGANKPDFSDARLLYAVKQRPLSHLTTIRIESAYKYKYVRYRKPGTGMSIAEFTVLDDRFAERPGKIIASPFLSGETSLQNIFDCNTLTYFDLPNVMDAWVGLAFAEPIHVARIAFCPRTDDNDISPGDLYELFYWDGEWISLGRKQAKDYMLTYDRVPRNALLWLRDLSRGVEERPFTWEEGHQVWW